MARPKNEVPMLPSWNPLWLRAAVPFVTSYASLKKLLKPNVPIRQNKDGKHLANWIYILGLDISHFTGNIVKPKEISEIFKKAAVNRAEVNAGKTDLKFCIKCEEYKLADQFESIVTCVCRRCTDKRKLVSKKVTVTEKRCNTPGCGVKPISEFQKNSRSKDLHCHKCRSCSNKIRRDWLNSDKSLRIKKALLDREWYGKLRANPDRYEKTRADRAVYRAVNSERIALMQAQHRERIRQDVERYEGIKAGHRKRSKEECANLTDAYLKDKLRALSKCKDLNLEGEEGKEILEAYRSIILIKRLNRKQRNQNEQSNELT